MIIFIVYVWIIRCLFIECSFFLLFFLKFTKYFQKRKNRILKIDYIRRLLENHFESKFKLVLSSSISAKSFLAVIRRRVFTITQIHQLKAIKHQREITIRYFMKIIKVTNYEQVFIPSSLSALKANKNIIIFRTC